MKYKSEAFAAIHETASGLHEAGLIDRQTMRNFDAACLTTVEPLSGEEIRAIRLQASISQAVFAHYLNVSSKQVSDWERGIKRPGSAAMKLLTLAKTKGIAAIV